MPGAASGQPFQATTVSASASTPRPHQACTSPQPSSSGTSVPEAAMPSPTPVKMTPPARPRRAGGTWGSTMGAASAMSAPPATPAPRRQAKYQENDSGVAQAKNATVASASMARSTSTPPAFRAIAGASSAPAR